MMSQISCTLTIHSHDEAAKLAHEIKVLTEETSSVTKKLTQIAENSAHSGEIIRVITIVSAIYLPGSFATVSAQTPLGYTPPASGLILCSARNVQSIFGMSFFDFVDETGRIAVAKDIYIFVILWAGLTILTGATFFWAYRRSRKRLEKVEEPALEAMRHTSTKLLGGLLSSTSGFERQTVV